MPSTSHPFTSRPMRLFLKRFACGSCQMYDATNRCRTSLFESPLSRKRLKGSLGPLPPSAPYENRSIYLDHTYEARIVSPLENLRLSVTCKELKLENALLSLSANGP